jgi:hypothetical protein
MNSNVCELTSEELQAVAGGETDPIWVAEYERQQQEAAAAEAAKRAAQIGAGQVH